MQLIIKRYIFLILVLQPILMFSQKKTFEPELYFGVNGGRTGSMVMFSPVVSQSYLLGYNGGLVFRYITDKVVGVQAELNMSQRGWNEASGLYSRQLNYIELPFMTHFYMGRNFRFFFNLGPKISYLISEKTLLNTTENSTEVQQMTPVQNAFDYGFCAGLGFMIKIKHQVFQVDTRANYSMSDVFSNDKLDYFDTPNNVNVSLNVAWLIKK